MLAAHAMNAQKPRKDMVHEAFALVVWARHLASQIRLQMPPVGSGVCVRHSGGSHTFVSDPCNMKIFILVYQNYPAPPVDAAC